MKIIRTKSGKFKGLSITQLEYNNIHQINKDSCLAVAEREVSRVFGVSPALASKLVGAVVFDYKYLTVED